mmetsp:Transcript_18840/g.28651  ORF Transcript_18840/g.28651 Transcript_18840/m.28651 type:complete len:94 (-) Transcript_18840:388-669(-)|eukprot:CAMPEP_0194123504 /NCGR_PEP_ID=MMETSP0150-20130528/54803_1 /TAXON_ID=122233 /ORGANISM="Chaetoceros debilis, Strain MM31A-1" /LENGTH=93 /DNA_ID=CAMNT_0038816769 /DNA_START=59 /DNA_END=340 /DNA_ORIENTATION=+
MDLKAGSKRLGDFGQKNSFWGENKKLKEEKRDSDLDKAGQIRQDPHHDKSKSMSVNKNTLTDQKQKPTVHTAELYYASALEQEMDEEGPISFQ